MPNHPPTPYYLIDESKLHSNIHELIQAFQKQWPHFQCSYSFKTNNLPWILTWMKKQGVWAEVVSGAEFDLALKLGFDTDKIVFNGPFKGWDTFKHALNSGTVINLDSDHEIEWLEQNTQPDCGWKVGMRINFNLEDACPGQTIPGKDPGRFGFNVENGSFAQALSRLQNIPGLEVVGIHGHHSTKTKSLEIFSAIAEQMRCAALKLHRVEWLDFGGCLFGDKPGAPSFDQYAQVICDTLKQNFDPTQVRLIAEPGSAVIASPMSYVTSIIDTRIIQDKSIHTVDGSLCHIHPQMTGLKFPIHAELPSHRQLLPEQIIGGFTCMEKDRIAILENKVALEVGDILTIPNVGAYSLSLAPLFIEYFPAVYVQSSENPYFCAREAWSTAEFLQKNHW